MLNHLARFVVKCASDNVLKTLTSVFRARSVVILVIVLFRFFKMAASKPEPVVLVEGIRVKTHHNL